MLKIERRRQTSRTKYHWNSAPQLTQNVLKQIKKGFKKVLAITFCKNMFKTLLKYFTEMLKRVQKGFTHNILQKHV